MTGICTGRKVIWYKGLLAAALLFLAVDLFSQELADVHKLWKDRECKVEGRHRSKAFVYVPEVAGENRPAVVIMPGGSYTYLGIKGEGQDVAKWFAARGFVAVVLRYRMGFYGARYPQQLEDYRLAMDYLKDSCRRFGIDTTRIGAVGFSAGGHLAGCAAMEDDPHYRADFVAMIYPVITMRDPHAHERSRKHLLRGDESLIAKLSLEENVTEEFPPVFLLHCEDDQVVDPAASHVFASELEKLGVTCHIEFHDKGGHGFGIAPAKSSGALQWQGRFVEWLEKTVFE